MQTFRYIAVFAGFYSALFGLFGGLEPLLAYLFFGGGLLSLTLSALEK